jgi:superkiller protein 3
MRQLVESMAVRRQHSSTLVSLGRTLERAGLSDSAVQLLRQAQSAHPDDFWLNFQLGGYLSGREDHEGAIRFYTAAVAIRPQAAAAHHNLGCVLCYQKKLDEAIAAYQQAIEFDPNFARPHYGLGTALYDQKKLDQAIAAYRKAIELDPRFANAHHGLGSALHDQKKWDAAVAAYRKAIELDPKSAVAYVSLGAILCDVRREYENAEGCFRRAIELDPKNADAHGNLGVALIHQGKLDEAITAFRKAIELDPKHPKARLHLGQVLGEKGWNLINSPDPKLRDPKRALAPVLEAVELAPQSEMAWQYLGWVQYRSGDWRASIEALEKSCKLQAGGNGDSYQWIVLALAHAQLAADEGLPDVERVRHSSESRRRYEPSAKDLDSKKWTTRPSGVLDQAVWDFRQEAMKLIGPRKEK